MTEEKSIEELRELLNWFSNWARTGLTSEEMYLEREKLYRNRRMADSAITELGKLRKKRLPNPLDMVTSNLEGLSSDERKAEISTRLLQLGNVKTIIKLQAKLEKAKEYMRHKEACDTEIYLGYSCNCALNRTLKSIVESSISSGGCALSVFCALSSASELSRSEED